MDKVYIVLDVWDDDGPIRVEKVFSTPEKASEYMDGYGLLAVEEWPVDDWESHDE